MTTNYDRWKHNIITSSKNWTIFNSNKDDASELFTKKTKHQQPQFYPRVKNLTEIKYTKEEMKLLNHGFQYSIEKPLTTYSTNLIIETENAIKILDTKLQNAYRILATKNETNL